MNADARHGGLRPKRCLPAKLHAKLPTTDSLKDQNNPLARRFVLSIPKSRQTIVTASNTANSRFFTDCYPISAVFTPKVNQIAPRMGMISVLPSHHEIHN
jgi:hypothetical protein